MVCGEDPRMQLAALWRTLGVPLVAMLLFVLLWSFMAARIDTSLGKIPGPAAVWEQAGALWADHKAERVRAAAFYERQQKRNAETLAADPPATPSQAKYTGRPTYIDQIFTSLKTVFTGFLFATLLAVPIGILCGMSRTLERGDQSLRAAVQADLAAGLAAHRHAGGQCGVRQRRVRCSRSPSWCRRSRWRCARCGRR